MLAKLINTLMQTFLFPDGSQHLLAIFGNSSRAHDAAFSLAAPKASLALQYAPYILLYTPPPLFYFIHPYSPLLTLFSFRLPRR
jgi:hypothetical protein